ncbi:hypothetical protein RJ640_000753, partial [Escallonia rubra]
IRNITRKTFQIPHMGYRACEFDVAHLISSYPRINKFDSALFTKFWFPQAQLIWELFQANAHSPLFLDRIKKSPLFSFDISGLMKFFFRNWVSKEAELPISDYTEEEAKKRKTKEREKKEENKRKEKARIEIA